LEIIYHQQSLRGKKDYTSKQIISPFRDTNFAMENEVFPTNYLKRKHDNYGGNIVPIKPFSNMKTFHGGERKPYMDGNLGDAIQTENIAKYHFNNTNHRDQYNQSVILNSHV